MASAMKFGEKKYIVVRDQTNDHLLSNSISKKTEKKMASYHVTLRYLTCVIEVNVILRLR